MNTNDWEIKDITFRNMILKQGTYLCELQQIAKVTLANNFKKKPSDPDEVDRLKFIFVPIGVSLDSGCTACEITEWSGLTNGKGGKLYKLACDMSESGFVGEDIRANPEKLKDYLLSFVGKKFNVSCEPFENKANKVISIRPAPRTPKSMNETAQSKFYYNIAGLDEQKKTKLRESLKSAKVDFEEFGDLLTTQLEVTALANFKTQPPVESGGKSLFEDSIELF